jgi:hypothetical protein
MLATLVAGALAGSLAGGDAWAAPSARLLYSRSESAASCPPESALRAAVAARFGYDPFFPWAPQAVVVQLGRGGAQYTARVELVDAQGIGRGTRSIASAKATCGELFEATALAISIALDASVAAAHGNSELEPRPEAGPPPSDAAPAAPASTPVDGSPRAEPALESAVPARADPRDATPSRGALAGLQGFVGADVLGSVGFAPSLDAGGEIFGGVRLRFVSLALGFRADAPASSSSMRSGGRVQSWLLAGTIAPCVHVSVAFGCGVAVVGTVEASALDVTLPESHMATFVAAGGRLGVELPLSARWAFRAQGELLANLRRVRLELDETAVWTAPSVGGDVAVGLAARFY